MKMKKLLSALLALCLLTCACAGTAEEAAPETAPEAATEEVPEGAEAYVFDDEVDEIVVDELIPVEDYAITEGLPEEWMNILLLGTDARGTNKYSRTDSMIVLSVNTQTGAAKLSSIMRDIWVQLPGHGGEKLNAACVYGGPELTMRTINEYFHLNIRYYALVNMRCLVSLVDALGGIHMDVTPAERYAINRLITTDAFSGDGNRAFATVYVQESGEDVLLNGKQALAYSRIRKSDSDYARTERQRKVLMTIARQLQQQGLFALTAMLPALLEYVETNLTFDEVTALAMAGMQMDVNAVEQFRVPVDDTYESGMYGTTWCIKPDFEENARLLHAFIYGE